MFVLNYEITPENYQDVIAFQLRLQVTKRGGKLRYILTNVLFWAMALYFCITRTEYNLWMRLLPVLMAVLLFTLTTERRSCSPRKVKKTYQRYEKLKILEEGYIGPHVVTFLGTTITKKYGKQVEQIDVSQCALVREDSSVSILLGGGVIFELIPNAILMENNNLEKLREFLGAEG